MISALFALLLGQNQGQAQIIQQQPQPGFDPPIQTSMGPMKASTANHHDVKVNVLSTDTFVSVKDVGDSQVVMVYRVDQFGKAQLLHKARFYY